MIRPSVPICIDGRMLDVRGTGVATYAETLKSTMEDHGFAPHVLLAGKTRLGRLGRAANALLPGIRRIVPCSSPARTLNASSDIFREAQSHFNIYGRPMPLACNLASGIMHWTYPVPLLLQGWTNIYTVHDAIPLLQPQLTTISPSRHARLLKALLAAGGGFVTVSDAARADIARALDLSAASIQLCPQGLRGLLPTDRDLASRSHFLFMGSIEPRKNLERLIAAHARSGSNRLLLLAGPLTAESGPIVQMAEVSPNVRLLRYQSSDDLIALLSSARALLFPSLAEGFGLPIAEAMTVGTPVLTSRGGGTQEVAGDSAMLVDPTDVDAIARAIAQLDADDALCARLVSAGFARAAYFTPGAYAERLAQLYSDIAPR